MGEPHSKVESLSSLDLCGESKMFKTNRIKAKKGTNKIKINKLKFINNKKVIKKVIVYYLKLMLV
jgi:hypothetical protein